MNFSESLNAQCGGVQIGFIGGLARRGVFPLCPGSRHIGAVALWANILVAAVSHGSSLGMMFMCDHGQVHFLLLSFPIFF